MRHLILAWLLLVPVCVAAQDMSMLKQPGVVALIRHALAPGTGDPARFTLGDCDTQRNLDTQGQAQARRIGELMRAAGVSFDAVWSSQWCRCLETAELLDIGKVEQQPWLNSFYEEPGRGQGQTMLTQNILMAQPIDAQLLLVTHQVNITALTGEFAKPGEIIVAKRVDGGLQVVGRIDIAP